MKLADLIDKLVEIQNQHPNEEVFVAIEYRPYNDFRDVSREISVEKLLVSGNGSFYRPEGLDFGNRKTVVVLDY